MVLLLLGFFVVFYGGGGGGFPPVVGGFRFWLRGFLLCELQTRILDLHVVVYARQHRIRVARLAVESISSAALAMRQSLNRWYKHTLSCGNVVVCC